MAKKDKDTEAKEESQEDEKKEESGEEKSSEEGAEGGEGEGGKKKKTKKKLLLFIIAILVVIAIAVPSILYLTGFFGNKNAPVIGEGGEQSATEEGGDHASSAEGAGGEDGGEGGEDGHGKPLSVYYDMEEFVVNLNVGNERPSFLKMTVSLELANELQIPRIEEKMPRIRDSFQIFLRELRQEDLQGSAGIYRLREELLLRVNKVTYPAKVNDILFKEILVQ